MVMSPLFVSMSVVKDTNKLAWCARVDAENLDRRESVSNMALAPV